MLDQGQCPIAVYPEPLLEIIHLRIAKWDLPFPRLSTPLLVPTLRLTTIVRVSASRTDLSIYSYNGAMSETDSWIDQGNNVLLVAVQRPHLSLIHH